MIPKLIKPALLSKRIPPVLTIVLAPIILALSVVVLSSRGDNNFERNFVVKLNTSTLLEDVLKVRPETATASIAPRAVFPPAPTITSLAQLEQRQLFPSPEEVTSWFNSVGSRVSTALTPSATGGGLLPGLGDSGGTGGSTGGTSGNGNLLAGLFGNGTLAEAISNGPIGQFFNNLGGQAATGLVTVANSALKGAVAGLGVADQYSIYLRDVCSTNTTAGTQNLGPQICTPLRDLASDRQGPPPNSTIQVGNVLIDYSALNIPAKLNGGAAILRLVLDALFAFQVIGIATIATLLLISPFLVFSLFQFRFLRAMAGMLSVLAAISLTLVTVIETLIGIVLPNIVNQIGDGLGVSAKTGGAFITMTVVSSTFAGLLAAQWVINLVVSYHERTYVRRDDDDISIVQDMPSMRKLRRPIIRLNTPPQERGEGEEEKRFMPNQKDLPNPFRVVVPSSTNRRTVL